MKYFPLFASALASIASANYIQSFGLTPLNEHVRNVAQGPMQFLTAASTLSPVDVALALTRSIFADAEFVLKDAYKSDFTNVTHVYLCQTLEGFEVTNAVMNINVDAFGRVISYGSSFASPSQHSVIDNQMIMGATPISASDAIRHLVRFLKLDDSASSFDSMDYTEEFVTEFVDGQHVTQMVVGNVPFATDSTVKCSKKFIVNEAREFVPTWACVVQFADEENWIDASIAMSNGKVLQIVNWVRQLSILAYPVGVNDPSDGERQLLVDPQDIVASPLGWTNQGNVAKGKDQKKGAFSSTIGNNVFAQSNPNGGSSYRTNYRPKADGEADNLSFVFEADLNKQPSTYIDAATANLFFWNNKMHDIFYHYGFDEKAGNFQENNLGRGGKGNDAVIANCQDGSGNNNANFATPPDGQKPRMRMYTWTATNPKRDGDFDSGIIAHEYGHGISIRLTGGPSNVGCLWSGEAGGMGEGWGDFWAVALRMRASYNRTKDFPMGDYSAGRGIRPYPYSTSLITNPHKYSSIKGFGYSGVHAKGAVWASILFDVYWSFVDAHGFDADWTSITKKRKSNLALSGNQIIVQLVVDGLKLQPCNPTFVDARDAIVMADEVAFNGEHACLLWKSFAKRGLGVGAKKGGTDGFDVPAECD